MKKKLFFLLSACMICTALLCITASAQIVAGGTCGDGLNWTLDVEGKLTVSGYGEMTSAPWSSHKGDIISVVIEDGVTSVYTNAFNGCVNIENVYLSDTLETIGKDSFLSCKSLEEINIPASVTAIGDYAFLYSGLKKITVDSTNQFYCTDDNVLFNIDKTKLILYIAAKTDTEYVIPSSVESVASYAFTYASNISTITIPASVTEFPAACFVGCTGINEIIVEKNNQRYKSEDEILYTIDGSVLLAYPASKQGDKFTTPESVSEIAPYAFSACQNLKEVTFNYMVSTVGSYAFEFCKLLEKVNMNDEICNINTGAFRNSGLKSIHIPGQINQISAQTFMDCDNLTYVYIDSDIEKIGVNAFYGCANLSFVSIPDTVTTINTGAFYGCSSVRVNYNYEMERWSQITIGEHNNIVNSMIFCYDGVLNRDITGGACGRNLYWILDDDGTLNISGIDMMDDAPWRAYEDSIKSVKLYNGITELVYEAFSGCENLISVSLPDSLEYIGDDAFLGTSIEKIHIPAGVTEICDGALSSLGLKEITVDDGNENYVVEDSVLFNADKTELIVYPALKSGSDYTVPSTVETIYGHAFSYAENLTNINIPESVSYFEAWCIADNKLVSINVDSNNTHYSSADGVLFNKEKTMLMAYPAGKQDTEYAVPESVVEIGRKAFAGNTYLTKVNLPDSITSIGRYAFRDCTALTGVTLPSSLTTIGVSVFECCTKLSEITFEPGLTTIGEGMFSGCVLLEEISIPDSVTNIGSSAFAETGLKTVTIPGSVEIIQPYTFEYCRNLKSVIIEDGVTNINEYAFNECKKLTSISLPSSITEISYEVFGYCPITRVDYNGTAANWEQISLYDNTLNKVPVYCLDTTLNTEVTESGTFGDGITWELSGNTLTIKGNGAIPDFDTDNDSPWSESYEAQNAAILVIEDGITSIGNEAFIGMNNLIIANIGKDVTRIGKNAFSSCQYLTEVNLPDGLTAIDDGAFIYCVNLEEFTIPANVSSIGDGAFTLCYSLKDININEDNNCFIFEDGVLFDKNKTDLMQYSYMKQNETYSIPDTVTNIRNGAFRNNYYLTEVNIPGSVVSVGEQSFATCPELAAINVDKDNSEYLSEDGVLYTKDKSTLVSYPSAKTSNEYTVPYGVKRIGDYSFYGCDNLTGVSLPSGIEAIGEAAFASSSFLKKINIPHGVKSIEYGAFTECVSLSTATLPESLSEIAEDAFYYCENLKDITIPGSITNIKDFAFYGCDNLSKVYFEGTQSQWELLNLGYGNDKLQEAELSLIENGSYFIAFSEDATNQNGEKITAENVGELKTLNISLEKISDGKPVTAVIAALYDESGKLVSFVTQSVTLTDLSNKVSIDIEGDTSNVSTIKVFAWRNLSKLNSMTENFLIEL